MTSRIASSKVLLYSTDPAHSVEVAEGWQLAQVLPGHTEYFLELVFVDGRQATNITDIFYVLDLIATGFFDAVVVIPPVATWSRARHKHNDGQNPLRARSVPLGITSLSPEEQSKIHHDNRQLECAAWFLGNPSHARRKRWIVSWCSQKTSAVIKFAVRHLFGSYESFRSWRAFMM